LANFTKSSMMQKIKDKQTLPEFSERELEVLRFICKGYSNFQIGEELCISNRTVERHKTNLIRKTNTTNTINLIIYAIKNKLVEDI
jgi:DNA-binding NarL/FixJ family response regulator